MTVQEKSHTWVFVALVVVIVALLIAGVALWREQEQTAEAKAKAREFIAALSAAGLQTPSEETAVRLFGADGGPYAQNPDEALTHSQYAWQLGTSGPATRPVILDPQFVRAAEIFVSVYAPDKLPEFQEFVEGLELQETID